MRTITINGVEKQIEEGTALSTLIVSLDLPDTRIAVELNSSVVRKVNWPETELSESDKIEIVHFVGGG